MRKQYRPKPAAKMSGGKKALLTVGTIVLLIVLFFLSFWITSLVLKANQEPLLPQQGGVSATPKPTYEELEKMVIEKEEKIKALEAELDRSRRGSVSSLTGTEPSASQKPTAKPTQAPTEAPTQVPTIAPTPAPTQTPTKAPEPTPTQTPEEETPEAAE